MSFSNSVQDRSAGLERYRQGPLAPFLAAEPFPLVDPSQALPETGSQSLIFAPWLLQDIPDYRGALQRWFDCLRIGGLLVLTVPHSFLFERLDGAPSRRRGQRRIYTPRSLIEEVEEALEPNSYRLRWLGDLDAGYDYGAETPVGQAEIGVAIERIERPSWGLTAPITPAPAPFDLFEPSRVRVERIARENPQRILVLKFDHLGDFLMGLDALRRLRAAFPSAEITLVVGSWNETLARELGLADQVVTFDAYPRHAGEEEPDIGGTRALFEAQITGRYDLAIDLRTNWDSRFLLRYVQAPVRAGLGLKAHFPFLDIFLPVDAHIDTFDTAWSEEFAPDRFQAQPYCQHSSFSIASAGAEPTNRGQAIIWGPYRPLSSGDYIFQPRLEIGSGRPGLMLADIAINTHRVTQLVTSDVSQFRLAFSNHQEQAQFEFRIFTVDHEPLPDFRFYGGRLSRRGAESALHQSEYLILLVELIVLRMKERGRLIEVAR